MYPPSSASVIRTSIHGLIYALLTGLGRSWANIFYIAETRSIKNGRLRFGSRDQHLKAIWMTFSTSASEAQPHDSRQDNIHNGLLRCIGTTSPPQQWTIDFHFLSRASFQDRHVLVSRHMANEERRCSSSCNWQINNYQKLVNLLSQDSSIKLKLLQ